MIGLVRKRKRIARVRRIQHGIAASHAAKAAGQVQQLETSRQRLAEMRIELKPAQGMSDGASLARLGELAMRLDSARQGLASSIDAAKATAAAREALRLTARRDQESAEKLQTAAERAARAQAERRPLRTGRIRPQIEDEGETP